MIDLTISSREQGRIIEALDAFATTIGERDLFVTRPWLVRLQRAQIELLISVDKKIARMTFRHGHGNLRVRPEELDAIVESLYRLSDCRPGDAEQDLASSLAFPIAD